MWMVGEIRKFVQRHKHTHKHTQEPTWNWIKAHKHRDIVSWAWAHNFHWICLRRTFIDVKTGSYHPYNKHMINVWMLRLPFGHILHVMQYASGECEMFTVAACATLRVVSSIIFIVPPSLLHLSQAMNENEWHNWIILSPALFCWCIYCAGFSNPPFTSASSDGWEAIV